MVRNHNIEKWLYTSLFVTGWVEVQWDHGGANSYRMGAEGKYDLDLTGEEPLVPPPPSSEEQAAVEEEVCTTRHKHIHSVPHSLLP